MFIISRLSVGIIFCLLNSSFAHDAQNESSTKNKNIATSIPYEGAEKLEGVQLFNTSPSADTGITLNKKDNGYRGIWYANQPSNDEYVYKYSGGLATYPANHYPFSVYVAKVNKTFFCYGGTNSTGSTLLHMVSYFDHQTGKVPQPTIVMDKKTDDAHDNPVLNIDEEGYIWLFSTSHGTSTVSYIHRSKKPYQIEEFIRINPTKIENGSVRPLDNFSYLQTYYHPKNGFINLFTHYDRNVIPQQPNKPRRTISYMTSSDGVQYSSWQDIAAIEEGHYQTSGQWKEKVGTSFNYHPIKSGENGLNYRTNLYYVQSRNGGKTWETAKGEVLQLPLKEKNNLALIRDYESEGWLVYINDIAFDELGNPAILYVLSKGYEAGPFNGPRKWWIAHYNGENWDFSEVAESDNNYDMGSLYFYKDENNLEIWMVIGPTKPGPQTYNTGGEMQMHLSRDAGKTWMVKALTKNSTQNHSYARKPIQAHPQFWAFWADGNGRKPSASSLYFCTKQGEVFQLPTLMKQKFEKPKRVFHP